MLKSSINTKSITRYGQLVQVEAGDTFERLGNQAIVIKDSCKVAVYVGGVVATGVQWFKQVH